MKRIMECILCSILIGTILFGIYQVTRMSSGYVIAENEYKALQDNVQVNLGEHEKLPYDIHWETLYETNPNIVAWIKIEGTEVNYPIVQGDNNQYYLTHTVAETENKCGSIFLDYENTSDLSDKNTIVYGHNMKNGSMFRTITKYEKAEFFQEHPSVWILTPSYQIEYTLLSAHFTPLKGSTYDLHFENDSEFNNFLLKEKNNSIYDTNIPINNVKQTVILSTCKGSKNVNRFVVCLVPKNIYS